MILAIDPGPEESAWVLLYQGVPLSFAKEPNKRVLEMVQNNTIRVVQHPLVIEEIASYGMPVGREVFQTVRWAGRFEQAFCGSRVDYITRNVVKNHLCHSSKAKDSNIRQALIDRFGGPQSVKKGGPLYKVSKDVWAALAVAVTWRDQNVGERAIA